MHMKWWGWGEEGVSFGFDDKPAFAAFMKSAIDLDVTKGPASVANLDSLPVPSPLAPPELRTSLQAVVASENVKDDALEQYDVVKSAIQQGFIDFGGTLSHHHAVGVEHAAWLAQDISPAGVTMIRSLLDGVDPGHNFNPGKIV